MVRRNTDYTQYDPQRYGQDHHYDIKLHEVVDGVQEVALRAARSAMRDPEIDRARGVEQAFGEYENEQQKLLDEFHKGQREQLQEDFMDEHRRELLAKEQEYLKGHCGPTDQLIYRENMNSQTRAFEDGVRSGRNQEFNDRKEQLTYQQAAQREYISHEIGRVQDQTMRELGLSPQQEQEQEQEQEQSQEPLMYRRQAQGKKRER